MAHQSIHRKLLAGAAVLAVALTAAACGGSDSDSGGGDSSGTYKWGINAEISGPLAFYGTTIRDGVKAYVDQVNADGGIDGHKIDLTIVDNGGDAARAATNTTQLAQSTKVNAIFGQTLSANCAAATPNAERYKVPMACLSVAEPNEWVFNMGPSNARAAGAVLAASKEVSDVSAPKLASVHVNTLTSAALGKAIVSGADDAGVDVVADEEIDITGTDFSAAISKVVNSDPDAISISSSGPNFTALIKGIRAAKVTAPIMWVDGIGNFGTMATIDDPALYSFGTYNQVNPDDASGVSKSYVEAMTPILDTVDTTSLANGNNAVAYMTAYAWGEALKKCGYPCSGEDLQKILTDFKADLTPMEPDFGYSSDDHYPYPNWYLNKIGKGGAFEPFGSYPTDPVS